MRTDSFSFFGRNIDRSPEDLQLVGPQENPGACFRHGWKIRFVGVSMSAYVRSRRSAVLQRKTIGTPSIGPRDSRLGLVHV